MLCSLTSTSGGPEIFDLVRELEFEARAALNWIDEYADLQGNGYISYQRRNEQTGLENQCWKDSWDSIAYHDGRLPGFPRATCELQGYAYDAKMRGARLARLGWDDPEYADRLEQEAADLKRRFNEDFWVADGEFFALALDVDGSQVDSLTSNNGHLLWSGIVDDDKAEIVARHLLGERLFSGWGIRTMAVGEGRYNPIGYHVGTVWPFDNSFIAWGLRRYGFKDEAAVVAAGILEAALAPNDARSAPGEREPGRRCGASVKHWSPRVARHPGPLGKVDAFGRGRVETKWRTGAN
jgi:glycogen debranching enzyme